MEIMSENSKYALHEHIQQITTPLQVIWGKQDQVGVSLHNVILNRKHYFFIDFWL